MLKIHHYVLCTFHTGWRCYYDEPQRGKIYKFARCGCTTFIIRIFTVMFTVLPVSATNVFKCWKPLQPYCIVLSLQCACSLAIKLATELQNVGSQYVYLLQWQSSCYSQCSCLINFKELRATIVFLLFLVVMLQ